MIWARAGVYAMSSPPWTVGKVSVRGITSYELWRDGEARMVGSFSTFSAAMREAERQQLDLGSLTAGKP